MSNSRVKAAILCGGEGTRLRPLSFYFQKTMIPVGSRQKPVLEYIVRLLAYHGFKDIVMLVGYKYHQIVNYFDDGRRFGVNIAYSFDDPKLKGTGGALYIAYRRGMFRECNNILIYYGDILSNVNLRELYEHHVKMDSDITLVISSGYQIPVGIVELDENCRVRKVVEKPRLDLKVSIGVMVIKTNVLKLIEPLVKEKLDKGNPNLDIMRDIIPYVLEHGGVVNAYEYKGEWYDIGSTERYEKLDHGRIDSLFKHLFEDD